MHVCVDVCMFIGELSGKSTGKRLEKFSHEVSAGMESSRQGVLTMLLWDADRTAGVADATADSRAN